MKKNGGKITVKKSLNYLRWVEKKAPKIDFMAFGFDGITRNSKIYPSPFG